MNKNELVFPRKSRIHMEEKNEICISTNKTPKVRWETLTLAQVNAEYLNKTYPKKDTKLVAYRCEQCDYYHLTTKYKDE
jgi:hypothetical protein